MPWVQVEKESMAATFRSTDPDASTLCDGWTTRHLLAHLVLREQDSIGAIGDRINRRPPGHEKYLGRLADQSRSTQGYEELLSRFLKGPSRYSPMSWAAEPFNFLEYVIHHEDVRRGGVTPLEPRSLPPAEVDSIWERMSKLSRFSYLKAPVGVTLAVPGGPKHVAKKAGAKQAAGGVVLTGDPVELLLYMSGRRQAAQVEVSGPSDAVAQFETWVATTN
jgi:uncharacterized protein (TIGR03085 family)